MCQASASQGDLLLGNPDQSQIGFCHSVSQSQVAVSRKQALFSQKQKKYSEQISVHFLLSKGRWQKIKQLAKKWPTGWFNLKNNWFRLLPMWLQLYSTKKEPIFNLIPTFYSYSYAKKSSILSRKKYKSTVNFMKASSKNRISVHSHKIRWSRTSFRSTNLAICIMNNCWSLSFLKYL